MESHLNLIKTDFKEVEKRVLPRFPFSYLTFKGKKEAKKVFEVKDISFSGMQLCLKDGGHIYVPGNEVLGKLHWHGVEVNITGRVQWVNGQRLGVEFLEEDANYSNLKDFLSYESLSQKLKPLHKVEMDLELPNNLKYWLRADGPVEIFIWNHNDGESSRFQIILMEQFVEWEDGKGLVTGRVLTKRDVETPLVASDEFVFQMDQKPDRQRLDNAKRFVSYIREDLISKNAKEFLLVKLG